jgi:putative hydrolase
MDMYVIDPHCHTVASGHAYSTVSEYAEEAMKKGLPSFAVTDHAPAMPGSAGYLYFHNLVSIPNQMYGVTVFTGVELNILDADGAVDLQESVYKKLNVVIAGLHVPCFAPTNAEIHTQAVIAAMRNPLIKIIAHLGDPRYPIDAEAVIKAAETTGTAIEINNASLNPENNVRSGGEKMVREIALECKRRRVPVIMGSDAHCHYNVGLLEHAVKLLQEINFPHELVLNRSMEAFTQLISS